jgi:hypothetical protein
VSTTRRLTEREYALISAILEQLPPETARPVADQLVHATVRPGDVATVTDIVVPDHLTPASTADGPLPVRAFVAPEAGEIIVWVTGGRLSGLEFAWITDEPPDQWPSPDDLTFV